MCSIWGTTWLGIRVSLNYLPPFPGAGFRFIIAGLFMYAFASATGNLQPLREVNWKLVGVFALTLFGLNYVLTYIAETHVSSGLTAVLFGVLPFYTFTFGHFMLGEKTKQLTWIGAAIALAGVAFISLAGQMRGDLPYAGAVLGASGVSAFGTVYAKRYAHTDPLQTLPPSMLLAGIIVAVIGVIMQPIDVTRAMSLPSIGALLYLAVAGSAIAFFLNLWLLKHVRVWIVSMSALIIPVLAVIVGVFAGGETFGKNEASGAALVIAGVWLALKADASPAAESTPAS